MYIQEILIKHLWILVAPFVKAQTQCVAYAPLKVTVVNIFLTVKVLEKNLKVQTEKSEEK